MNRTHIDHIAASGSRWARLLTLLATVGLFALPSPCFAGPTDVPITDDGAPFAAAEPGDAPVPLPAPVARPPRRLRACTTNETRFVMRSPFITLRILDQINALPPAELHLRRRCLNA